MAPLLSPSEPKWSLAPLGDRDERPLRMPTRKGGEGLGVMSRGAWPGDGLSAITLMLGREAPMGGGTTRRPRAAPEA